MERGKKKQKGVNIIFSKTKQKTQRDLNSLLESYKNKTYILSHSATVPVLHNAPRCRYYTMRRIFDFMYLALSQTPR